MLYKETFRVKRVIKNVDEKGRTISVSLVLEDKIGASVKNAQDLSIQSYIIRDRF
jgi:hypothetical protein